MLTLPLLLAAAGCPQAASWRDKQIQQSHQLAAGDLIVPPAQPVSVPRGVARALPLDDSFVVLEYVKQGDEVQVKVLSSWDAVQTTQWLIAWLAGAGYSSDDNPSRVLEGVTYTKAGAKYGSLWVRVSLNSEEQCTLELKAAGG